MRIDLEAGPIFLSYNYRIRGRFAGVDVRGFNPIEVFKITKVYPSESFHVQGIFIITCLGRGLITSQRMLYQPQAYPSVSTSDEYGIWYSIALTVSLHNLYSYDFTHHNYFINAAHWLELN